MKYLFTLLLVFCFSNLRADYYKVKIMLTDGQIMKGFAELPSNKLFDNSIRFKNNESGNSKKIKDKEIDKILYITSSGNKYVLERKHTRRVFRAFGKDRESISNKKFWLLLSFHHSKIDYYVFSGDYLINEEGTMVAKTVDRSGSWADIFLLLKHPNEVTPTLITSLSYGAMIIGKEKQFRTCASIFFSDHKTLVERIEKKEFKHDQIRELIDAFIALKESQSATHNQVDSSTDKG